MIDGISALDLRRVGYGIPSDLFGAVVTGCVEVVRTHGRQTSEKGFKGPSSLARVVNEVSRSNGSSCYSLIKAVGKAPRGRQTPLTWSVETGSKEPARPIVTDLLTIRATRDRGYYHIDPLLERLEITRRSARRHAA